MKNFFKNKKILITGASGSIGKSLVLRLLKTNCNVIRAFSNDENGLHELSESIDGAYFVCQGSAGASTSRFDWNFGSPPYAVSSGNSDGNGHGNFEYSVPSGYLAWCTKNLGSDGG